MELVNYQEANFREQALVTPPVTSARVQTLRGHDEQSRPLEGHGKRSARCEIPCENADLMTLEPPPPSVDKFVGQGSKRSQIDGAGASIEYCRNRLFGQPGFSGP